MILKEGSPFPEDIKVKTIRHTLDTVMLGTQTHISTEISERLRDELNMVPQLRNTLKLNVDLDYILKGMMLRLTGWILRDQHKHTVTKTMSISVPTTWWEMLKRDHLPEWWKRRWPVVNHTLTKDYTFEEEVRVCPHADVAWKDPHHIEFLEFQSDFSREKPGVKCPTCGVGQDTDGDGNCAWCGPRYQQLSKV